jgi:isocitrate lyase
MSTYSLPLSPPPPPEEQASYSARVSQVSAFFSLPRFAGLRRPYSPEAVASKQGSLPVLPLPSTLLSDKLFALLTAADHERRPVHTLGAVDPVQMTQMARWLDVLYVSGWACSSLLTTGNNDVGPDLGFVLFISCFAS